MDRRKFIGCSLGSLIPFAQFSQGAFAQPNMQRGLVDWADQREALISFLRTDRVTNVEMISYYFEFENLLSNIDTQMRRDLTSSNEFLRSRARQYVQLVDPPLVASTGNQSGQPIPRDVAEPLFPFRQRRLRVVNALSSEAGLGRIRGATRLEIESNINQVFSITSFSRNEISSIAERFSAGSSDVMMKLNSQWLSLHLCFTYIGMIDNDWYFFICRIVPFRIFCRAS